MTKGMLRFNDGSQDTEAAANYMQQLAERNLRTLENSRPETQKADELISPISGEINPVPGAQRHPDNQCHRSARAKNFLAVA